MTRIASERILHLFALAEVESRHAGGSYADRYVDLARRVGTRYNVRLPPELTESYCRGCSSYWVEGRTVRTRLRDGRRTRTCLVCGRVRRHPLRRGTRRDRREPEADLAVRSPPVPGLVGELVEEGDEAPDLDDDEV